MSEVIAPYELDLYEQGESVQMFVSLVADFETEIDPHYGTDADGRRGEVRETLRLTSLSVWSVAGRDITTWLKEKHPKAYERVREYAREVLSTDAGGG